MMISYLRFCIILCSLFVGCYTKRANGNRNSHWVFIWYHNSGHGLSHLLSNKQFEANPSCHSVTISTSNIRNNVYSPIPSYFYWQQMKFVTSDDYYIVHFARDPVDMILSGYLYHKQAPSPAVEQWLAKSEYDPCMDHLPSKSGFFPTLMRHTNKDIMGMVNNVTGLCNRLKNKYWNGTYHKTLNAAEMYDGIRFEAAKAILSNDGILSMAYDCLQQKINPRTNVFTRRTFTSEFPVQDSEMYKRSMEKVIDFLMPPKAQGNFYDCLGGKVKAIDQALLLTYSRLPSSYSANATIFNTTSVIGVEHDEREHISSNQMSKEERTMYMKRLESDDVLGPILALAKQIVFDLPN